MGTENLNPDAIETQLRDDATRRAAADPLPGPVATAFLEGPITIGKYTVRRVVLSDWAILRGLKSPIIQQMLEMQKDEAIREPIDYSDQDGWEMIWQFTHTPAENRALLAKGREAYAQAALGEIGDSMEVGEGAMVVDAVQTQIMHSFATAVKHGTAEDTQKKSNRI